MLSSCSISTILRVIFLQVFLGKNDSDPQNWRLEPETHLFEKEDPLTFLGSKCEFLRKVWLQWTDTYPTLGNGFFHRLKSAKREGICDRSLKGIFHPDQVGSLTPQRNPCFLQLSSALLGNPATSMLKPTAVNLPGADAIVQKIMSLPFQKAGTHCHDPTDSPGRPRKGTWLHG